MNVLFRAWRLLTPRERRRCTGLQLLGVLMALTTVAGIAAVMPFFAVLGDPGLIERNAALAWLQSRFGIDGHQDFIVLLGCGFIALLLLGSVVNLAGSVAMSRFAWRVGDRLRLALFSQYLARDYLFHARQRGAVLTSRVLYQSDRVTGLMQSALLFVSNLLVIVLIVASIALVDARVAAAGLLLFGVSYALVYAAARRRLLANGFAQTQAGADRVAVVEQALAGIKDLLVSQGQAPFTRRFAAASAAISRAASHTQFIGLAPRYLLECLAGVTLILAALILGGRSSTAAWLGELTFIAVAGYRLLPAIQQAYFSFVTVRANQDALDEVAADLAQATPLRVPAQVEAMRLHDCIELVDTAPRRGAMEHYYRATSRAYLTDRDWHELPKSARVAMSADLFQMILDDVVSSLEGEVFDEREDRHMSWTPMMVDEQGWKEINGLLDAALKQVLKAQAASVKRLAKSKEEGINMSVSMLGYEVPEKAAKKLPKRKAKGRSKAKAKK